MEYEFLVFKIGSQFFEGFSGDGDISFVDHPEDAKKFFEMREVKEFLEGLSKDSKRKILDLSTKLVKIEKKRALNHD